MHEENTPKLWSMGRQVSERENLPRLAIARLYFAPWAGHRKSCRVGLFPFANPVSGYGRSWRGRVWITQMRSVIGMRAETRLRKQVMASQRISHPYLANSVYEYSANSAALD
jgi:hypothetical protein